MSHWREVAAYVQGAGAGTLTCWVWYMLVEGTMTFIPLSVGMLLLATSVLIDARLGGSV